MLFHKSCISYSGLIRQVDSIEEILDLKNGCKAVVLNQGDIPPLRGG